MQRVEWKGLLNGGQWKEATVQEFEVGLNKVATVQERWSVSGEMEGAGDVHYLLAYAPDGGVDFTGFERFEISNGEHQGSVVVSTQGRFEGMTARGTWQVIPAMCTGDFEGVVEGGGHYVAEGHDPAPFVLWVVWP